MTQALDLLRLHPYAEAGMDSWYFFKHAYEGTRSLILNENVLPRHPRESKENYDRRLKSAYGFGYSAAVVDLLTFYLFQQPASHEWGSLGDDSLFKMFQEDSDLYGTDADVFLIQAQKAAAIQGHSGILVDKPVAQVPTGEGSTPDEEPVVSQADAEDKAVYPYMSLYEATNILNWSYQRDSFGRPFLSRLVLLDTPEEDGVYRYRVWTPETWEVWVSNTAPYRQGVGITFNAYSTAKSVQTHRESSGVNTLSTIPFTWVINSASSYRNIGVSDLKEVGYIDASIIRNLSQSEEVIDYTAFPMMMKPMLPPGNETDDTVGATAVIEFDPNYPEAKPQWLEAVSGEPIDAILSLISKKVEEIYRSVNAGGLQATEVSSKPKSGVALQQEFRLLNAKLASKSANLEEAEKSVINFWMQWEGKEPSEDMNVSRPREFNISDLLIDLEAALAATVMVNSETFDKAVQKTVARRTLTEHDDFSKVDEEIETYVEPEPIAPGFAVGEQSPNEGNSNAQ